MVLPKNGKYKLQCEWASCRDIHENMDEFYKHLDQHFWTDIANVPLEPGCTLVCQWCDCNFVTTNGHDLIRHLYFHGFHTKLKWLGFLKCEEAKCGECQINQNRNIIPELPDGFKCCWEECFVVVDIPDKFYEHVRDHAGMADPEGESKNVFKCHWEGCSYEYKADDKAISHGRHKLRGHMNTHTQERSYACPWCGNLYVNKTKLIDHYTRQTNAEYHTFQCTHCSRTFASERILKDHMRHHVNHYQCPKCAMTCPNPSALKHHIRYKHSNERPFACEFCEYRSKERHDLHRHMQFHQSDLSYHCQFEGCDYVVRSIQNLRYHYRVKHASGDGKQYVCHLCDKKHATGYQLTHHLGKTHSFQWPPGHCRFRYNECEDGFFRLQIFRYESMELTQQLMNNEAAKSVASHEPSTSVIASSPGKPLTRLNVARRKKADAARKLTLNKTTGNTRKLRNRKTKSTTTTSKKKSTKRKSSAVSPKAKPKPTRKSTVVSPKEKSSALFNENSGLPDLYIESGECLEAADALCNMKTNSAKKKNLENQRTAGVPEPECHRTESRDSFLDEICANAVDIDSDDSIELDLNDFQPTPLRNMNTRNVGGAARGSSAKKSPSVVTSPNKRFARARKRLKLTGTTTEKTTHVSKSLAIRASTADENFEDSNAGVVALINAPVFPDHHKLYCGQADKSVTICKNRYRISPRKQVTPRKNLVGDDLYQNGASGSLLQELNNLPLSNAIVFESAISVSPSSEPKLSQSQEKNCEDSVRSGAENQDSTQILNKLDSNKLVEVNGSEVVLDEDGNRTVVSVGGEDFYLVSGTDTNRGGTVYCLVKATEFTEAEK